MIKKALWGVLVGGVVLSSARQASAQACCAGGSTFTPARLAIDEDWLAGATVRGSLGLGSFDPAGAFASTPAGATDLYLEQDLLFALRVLHRGQVSLAVPFLETYRRASGRSEAGGGIGDVNVALRYDFVTAKAGHGPGIAGLLGLSLPSGTAPESASTPLATGATGLGTVQGHLGAAFEAVAGPWLFNLTTLVAARAPRNVGALQSVLGPRFTFLAGAARVFEDGVSVGASVTYEAETRAFVDGQGIPGSDRRLLTFAVSAVWPLLPNWRLQSSVFVTPPIPALSSNEPAAAGLTVTLLRTGLFGAP